MAKAIKKTKEKKEKLKDFKYYGFNIKLISTSRKGEALYYSIIESIFTKKVQASVGSDKAVCLRNQFSKEFDFRGQAHKILYGAMTRYVKIEGNHWFKPETGDYEDVDLPKNAFPNGFDADYIFIPAVHKFFVAIQGKVSISMIYEFLTKAIKEVIPPTEDFTINVMQAQDKIDEILDAPELKSLYISVTYTNDDAGDKALKSVDKILKDNYIGKITASLKSDNHGTLNTDQDLIRGLIELSKDNGEAKATIVNEDGRRETIKTSDFPEKISVKAKDSEVLKKDFFSMVMAKYKDDAGD